MNLLAGLCGIYSLLILFRILLSWFSGAQSGKAVELLNRVTDPYLNWWKRVPWLRLGYLDMSPIAAMAAISILQTIFSNLARFGTISIGVIIAISLGALWSAVSFLLGFCVIILILRFIAHMFSRNTMSGFWNIIDTISRPILYRINRIIFRKRIINYMTSLVVSGLMLILVWMGGKIIVQIITTMLVKPPV